MSTKQVSIHGRKQISARSKSDICGIFVIYSPDVDFTETFPEGLPSVGLKRSKIGFTNYGGAKK
jgi:hypothetical protein